MVSAAVPETQEPLVEPVDEDKQSFMERFAITVVFVSFVLMRALDRVFNQDLSAALSRPSYTLIWTNILWPVAIQLMTVCMLLVYIMVMRYQGNKEYTWRFFLPGNPMASTMGAVPMLQLALFSFGDQLNGALQSPAAPFVKLPIQSVMTNSVLIWMVIIAFFWIRARYQQVHYIGVALVLISIIVQISPKLTSNDCSGDGLVAGECFASYKAATGKWVELDASQMVMWYVLFFVSTLPSAAGNVYKQKVLQGRDVDVCYATWWSGNFQILWGWLFVPLLWIPLPGQDVLSPSETFREIGYTLSCIQGNMPRPDDFTCATKPAPWIWIVIYLCFNLSFNVALLWLTKRMGAAWAQIGTVLCLNLCSIFSQFHVFAGDSAQIMGLSDWLGLVIASIALWSYNQVPETNGLTDPTSGSIASETKPINENNVVDLA